MAHEINAFQPGPGAIERLQSSWSHARAVGAATLAFALPAAVAVSLQNPESARATEDCSVLIPPKDYHGGQADYFNTTVSKTEEGVSASIEEGVVRLECFPQTLEERISFGVCELTRKIGRQKVSRKRAVERCAKKGPWIKWSGHGARAKSDASSKPTLLETDPISYDEWTDYSKDHVVAVETNGEHCYDNGTRISVSGGLEPTIISRFGRLTNKIVTASRFPRLKGRGKCPTPYTP